MKERSRLSASGKELKFTYKMKERSRLSASGKGEQANSRQGGRHRKMFKPPPKDK